MTDEVKSNVLDKVVNIHGKNYMTVAGRVELAHQVNEKLTITTDLVDAAGVILMKATVTNERGTYTGYSAANPAKAIEKLNPYEVAETSAVGRALGFAGYGLVDGIASADEMVKSQAYQETDQPAEWGGSDEASGDTGPLKGWLDRATADKPAAVCAECGSPAKEKQGISKNGKPYHAIFCDTGEKSHTQWL